MSEEVINDGGTAEAIVLTENGSASDGEIQDDMHSNNEPPPTSFNNHQHDLSTLDTTANTLQSPAAEVQHDSDEATSSQYGSVVHRNYFVTYHNDSFPARRGTNDDRNARQTSRGLEDENLPPLPRVRIDHGSSSASNAPVTSLNGPPSDTPGSPIWILALPLTEGSEPIIYQVDTLPEIITPPFYPRPAGWVPTPFPPNYAGEFASRLVGGPSVTPIQRQVTAPTTTITSTPVRDLVLDPVHSVTQYNGPCRIVSLPGEVQNKIFSYLNRAESTVLGVTCAKLYKAHWSIHGKVNMWEFGPDKVSFPRCNIVGDPLYLFMEEWMGINYSPHHCTQWKMIHVDGWKRLAEEDPTAYWVPGIVAKFTGRGVWN